jgi:hypothetical protein
MRACENGVYYPLFTATRRCASITRTLLFFFTAGLTRFFLAFFQATACLSRFFILFVAVRTIMTMRVIVTTATSATSTINCEKQTKR